MKKQKRLYTKEMIEDAVIGSFTIADVCRKIGCPISGGSYELVKNRIKEYNIDISHFTGKSFYGDRNHFFKNRKPPEEVLVDNLLYRLNNKILTRCMIEKGIKYKCSNCSISEWDNKPITLDVDHINGDWSNSKIDNLRFLCPNCHRQTDTFAGKNIKKKKVQNYCTCGNVIFKTSTICRTCSCNNKKTKIDMNELKKDVWLKPFKELSKIYNLSDNRLNKICKENKIDVPPRGYWITKNKDEIDISIILKELEKYTIRSIAKNYKMSMLRFKKLCLDNNINIELFNKKKGNQYVKNPELQYSNVGESANPPDFDSGDSMFKS